MIAKQILLETPLNVFQFKKIRIPKLILLVHFLLNNLRRFSTTRRLLPPHNLSLLRSIRIRSVGQAAGQIGLVGLASRADGLVRLVLLGWLVLLRLVWLVWPVWLALDWWVCLEGRIGGRIHCWKNLKEPPDVVKAW